MATVTGLTAERMIEMENATVIGGEVVAGELILITKDNTEIVAGTVQGPQGPSGGAFTICTSSTRPSWAVMDEGKAIFETDTNLIRVWTGTSWKLQERIIATSTTHPAMTASDEGVTLYETDTDLELVWTGIAWIQSANNSISIPTYTTAASRAAAWPDPPNGALSYLNTHPGVLWMCEADNWISVGIPPGTMSPFIGAVAPNNWVLMYGQTITNAETLYPLLWSLIDGTFKSGSSLLVPDLRGRIPVGKDNMGGASAGRVGAHNGLSTTLGDTGGDSYLQSHGHGVNDPGHSHTTGETLEGPGPYGVVAGGKAIKLTTSPGLTYISINDSGGGSAGNVQPSIILNWILKIL